ncbi:MAG: pyridoxal phosphate-dependent aminotransferase [Planctomycetes bacterium]|nr:pyridoxal phosphate-dependent aminotransferase [Planctomycetota bacterium]
MSGLVPNARSHRIVESATLAITATANKLRAAGRDVVSLGAGEPDFPVPPVVAAAGVAAIEQGNTRYTPAAGMPSLRAAGARWLNSTFGMDYDDGEVMVTAGAKGALHMALEAIVEPGDPVLILAPYWVSYPALVTMADGEPVIVPAVPEQRFVHSAETIERAAVEHGAKGILLNYPNNPSGAVPTRAQLQAIVDVAVRHDLWVISDEIYATLLYDDAEHVSPAVLPGGRERTVVVSGFTKSHTLTGWRTSFLAGPAEIVATCARLQSQLLGNPCTISQAAMLEACNNPQPQLLAERLAAYDQRRRFLVEAIDPLPGVSLPTPKGAFYALIDIRRLCDARGIDDVTACSQLLEDHHLALVPGSAFAAPGFVRASFATSMDNLQKAAARFRAWVEAT